MPVQGPDYVISLDGDVEWITKSFNSSDIFQGLNTLLFLIMFHSKLYTLTTSKQDWKHLAEDLLLFANAYAYPEADPSPML
jgi:hypothetical protein